MAYKLDKEAGSIITVTITANGNTCAAPIPVTFPANVTDTQGFTVEQVGSDPMTLGLHYLGSPCLLLLAKHSLSKHSHSVILYYAETTLSGYRRFCGLSSPFFCSWLAWQQIVGHELHMHGILFLIIVTRGN